MELVIIENWNYDMQNKLLAEAKTNANTELQHIVNRRNFLVNTRVVNVCVYTQVITVRTSSKCLK